MLYDIEEMLYDIEEMLYDIGEMLYDIGEMLYDIGEMLYDIEEILYDIEEIYMTLRKIQRNHKQEKANRNDTDINPAMQRTLYHTNAMSDVINTELWIDGCSWVQEFKSLTKQNLIGLSKKYKQNCNCQIKHCTGRNCRHHQENCEFRHEIWGCYRDYGICDQKKLSGSCHWKQNKDFYSCIKQSNRKD
ncbi:unnamed protein product [Mytilus coruscus]|uniref:Uncharacterized protein n=1 Tax=Mytilus coruscus TaxID=42192 RepID=A0A6J8BCV0_MYTCO|nr:unnamed protein product [Mytilus coruscus]